MTTAGVLRARDGRVRLGWRLLLFVVVALAVMSAGVVALPSGILSVSASMLAGGLVAGWLLLAMDGRPPGALGFWADRMAVADTLRGLALGVALGLLVVVAIAGFGGMRWSTEAGTPSAWAAGGVSALLFLAVPAAAEEAVLRGYPLQALAEAWGPLAALAVTSVLFGLLHLGNPGATTIGLLNVTAAGAFLGVVYLKTASLWYATGAHLGWNWSHGYLADVPVSGYELMDAPYYEGVATGPAWLGGGAFGPEGSAVATVLVLAAAALLWKGRWLRATVPAYAADPLAHPGALRPSRSHPEHRDPSSMSTREGAGR